MAERPWSRREILKAGVVAAALGELGTSLSWRRPAAGASTLQLGFIATRTAEHAARCVESRAGVALGLGEAERAAALLGWQIELHDVDSAADDTEAAARDLVAGRRVHAIVGGFDEAECERIGLVADQMGIPFLNVGARADALRETRCRRRLFHIEASESMYRDALRLDMTASIERQVPLERRTQSRVALWHHTLERYGAGQLNDRFEARFQRPMQPHAWAGWMAVKVVWEGVLRTRGVDGASLVAYLRHEGTRFDGHKGKPLSFRSWNHQLRQPLYLTTEPGESARHESVPAAREVPRDDPQVAADWNARLDELGGASRADCAWLSA